MEALGERFSVPLFVNGPRYETKKESSAGFNQCILRAAKMAIWSSRKSQILGQNWTDVVQSLKGLVAARLRVEHTLYCLTNNLQKFKAQWGFCALWLRMEHWCSVFSSVYVSVYAHVSA